MNTPHVKELIDKAVGLDGKVGDERLQKILHRVLSDIFRITEEFDVTPTEFCTAASYLSRIGQTYEAGLRIAGLGIEHFLDVLLAEKVRRGRAEGGSPRHNRAPAWL